MSMDKVVVITGASSGIGATLARLLAGKGHAVVLAARRERELGEVAAGCPGALVVPTDVTRRDEVERLRDRALAERGRVDVWINNAGRGIGRPVLDLGDTDIDDMLATNLKSAIYGMQAIVPHFQQRGEGHLINVSTMLSRIPFATFRSAYAAAKAGLNILTAQLRMDLRASHPRVHVSLVLPGIVHTPFHEHALHGTPFMPPGGQTAEEVAAAMAGLIDDPQPELYTMPALADLLRRYHADVEAFEVGLTSRT
jgi:NAD(P)-dependent dehydrogenase (short-subunit alcohol dehydrogenase family)